MERRFGGAVAQVLVRCQPSLISHLILSNTGVPLRRLVPSVRLFEWIAGALPWKATAGLLRRPMLKALGAKGEDIAFWNGYMEDLLTRRLTKKEVLPNFHMQAEYHRRFHFSPQDQEG